MPPRSDADDEFQVLTTEAGRRLLDAVARVATPGPADLQRWRGLAEHSLVAAALRLSTTRRRAGAKFDRADRMWFDPTGLEQATASVVAAHKARRFAGPERLAVDLCCGVGGDAIALASACGRGVLAVDLDPGMARRTRWNADVHDAGANLLTVVGRAETTRLPADAWVHFDPDRRAGRTGGRRAMAVDDYRPGLGFLRRLIESGRGGAIKLGPASDFATTFDDPRLEVEVVSLDGECKEATVWYGEAATCRRRATTLPSAATWTGDVEWQALEVGPVGRWVYDPDASLSRAGLLDSFGRAHGLMRFAGDVDFLTGDEPVDSPFLARFEVLDVLPLDLKRLRRALMARDVGPLVVKTRGVMLRPEEVRTRLKLSGTQPGTVLLTGGAGPARAIVVRRADRIQADPGNAQTE